MLSPLGLHCCVPQQSAPSGQAMIYSLAGASLVLSLAIPLQPKVLLGVADNFGREGSLSLGGSLCTHPPFCFSLQAFPPFSQVGCPYLLRFTVGKQVPR